jgi:hypothetical protein
VAPESDNILPLPSGAEKDCGSRWRRIRRVTSAGGGDPR